MILNIRNRKHRHFSNDTKQNSISWENHPYLQEKTTEGIVPNRTILAICDFMFTGVQFIRCLKLIDNQKVLGVVISLNPRLKYTPTRTIGQLLVVRVLDKELKVLENMVQNLTPDELKDLNTTKYGVLSKRPSEEEERRMKKKDLIEEVTLLTVTDDSGAEYVRYIKSIPSVINDKTERAIVQVVTLCRKRKEFEKRKFLTIKTYEYYVAELDTRPKTFTRKDGSGEFTKLEYCAKLIRKLEE